MPIMAIFCTRGPSPSPCEHVSSHTFRRTPPAPIAAWRRPGHESQRAIDSPDAPGPRQDHALLRGTNDYWHCCGLLQIRQPPQFIFCRLTQGFQLILHRVPHETIINDIVFMSVNIAHCGKAHPIDFRMALLECIRETARGFRDNLESAGYV